MEQTAAPPALSNGFNHIKAIMKAIVQTGPFGIVYNKC